MSSLFAFSLCVLIVCQVHSQDVTVDTDVGTFVGIKGSITIGDTTYKVAKFLGIPYAEPPVGNLRFRVPVPKVPHSGSMLVQKMSLRCFEIFPFDQLPMSEDCLYLNVVVPEKLDLEKLPVMVWIHGGGFVQGSANEYELEGLAAYGNVIVVAMNYRLSVWGFLSTDDSNSPGNYGLWDQRLALQWVKDNIEAFGGDAFRITIFGESAGASSVIHQGLYPGNRGLFQRMIAQSGTAAVSWSYTIRAKQTADYLANKVGCYSDNANIMISCLRNLNSSVLYSATNDATDAQILTFKPSIDNVFVTCNPEDVLNLDKSSASYEPARETFASFDLMSGVNSGEGALFVNVSYGDPETFLPDSTYFRNVIVRNSVNTIYSEQILVENTDAVVDAIYDEYTDDNTIDDPYVLRINYYDIFGDALFLAPNKRTVDSHDKLSTKSTYMYYLSVVPSYNLLPTPSWYKRANHADDIIYLFPTEQTQIDDQEILLADLMITTWTNFAKTGDPNSPRNRNLNWRQYTESNPVYVDLKRGTTSEDVKEGLLEDRAVFWLNEMPPVVGYVSEPCEYILETSGAPPRLIPSCLVYTLLTLCVFIF